MTDSVYDITIVLVVLTVTMYLLVKDYMRPGAVLFIAVTLFVAAGIITPGDALAGFSNKGVATIALLFLVSEGIRRSNALGHVVRRLLPQRNPTVKKGYARILPIVATVSSVLNNTPVVVIFIPIVKEWLRSAKLPLGKFLIPLSYVSIFGGMCTLIGTSTNLVVHGMMLDAGYQGLGMFELAWIGVPITLFGLLYLYFFGERRIPQRDPIDEEDAEEPVEEGCHLVRAVISSRFAGIDIPIGRFDFRHHFGATLRAVYRNGAKLDPADETFRSGDTLLLESGHDFLRTWRDSSMFLMLSNGEDRPAEQPPRWKKRAALALFALMIVGAVAGSLPFLAEDSPLRRTDMFFWAAIAASGMACLNLFPAKHYTKFISWDILVTIACALAISRAMVNSGLAECIAAFLIELSGSVSPWVVLGALYVTTNLITEMITNNAAAAFAFPVATSAASQLGVDPMPFFIAICIAASASFSTPIGYQTNMIVQGIGNYKFKDFVRVGLPLNILAFLLSMFLIPLIWKF